MTEWTLLDAVTLLLFFLMGFGLWGMLLEWLYWGARRQVKRSQCPPHEWEQVYRDGPKVGEYIFDGLKCSKCHQRPGGMQNGESWNLPITPP